MAADFEEESRLARETVTRPASNPNLVMGLAAFGLVAVVLGGGWYASLSKQAANKPRNGGDESFKTAQLPQGFSVEKAAVEPPAADNKFVIPVPPPVVPPAPPVVAPAPSAAPQATVAPVDQDALRRAAEAERLRKEAEAKLQARLRSPMLLVSDREATASVDPDAAKVTADKDEEDPNKRFLQRSEADVVKAHATVNKRTDALAPQGFMIRAVLETAVQSDLAGMVRAITTEDVYSFDGRRVLIPKGTMLTGEYKSSLSRGQTRVFMIWTRMLRADGVSMMLGSIGTDSLGRSGVTGEVDDHFVERFGSAMMLTIAGGTAQFIGALGSDQSSSGVQYAYDSSTGQLIPIAGSQNSTLNSARQIGANTVAQSVTKMAEEALKNSINIPPTIHIDQGTRIIVFVKRDLDFSEIYPDPVKEALYELRHQGRKPKGPNLGSSASFLPSGGYPDQGVAAKP
jgi:type IV secretion system protein VirB10